jgi:hypothetical protein
LTGGPVADFSIIAPKKMPKSAVEISVQGSDVVSNTSPRIINFVNTWSYVSNVLQYVLINHSDDSSENEKDDLSTKYKIISQAKMHKVVARPQLLPYCDMIRWALDHVDILTRTINNEHKVVIGTFRLEHLRAMYKLSPTPNLTHNDKFIEGFKKKECKQYGLLLSRSRGAKLGGSLQLDMTYATIPVFGGQFTWLYRETRLAYTVSDP